MSRDLERPLGPAAAGLVAALLLAATISVEPARAASPVAECRNADGPIATCLATRVAELRAELRRLDESAGTSASSGLVDAIETGCAAMADTSGLEAPRLAELACLAEHLAAQRELVAALPGLETSGSRPDTEHESTAPDSTGEPPLAETASRPEAPPSAPVAAEESGPPTAAEGASVRPLTAASTTPSRQETVDMTSPMELAVDILVLDALRPGYGWSTTETEPYRAEGVSVLRLVFEKESSRKGAVVEVSAFVHGERYLQRARLTLTLVTPDGAAVGTASSDWFPLGRGIKAQADGGIEKTFRFELTQDELGRLTAGPEPPGLRLRVEAGKN